MNIKQVFNKVGHSIKKNSPAILTGVGIIGLGATAYLAYKSRDKVEEIVADIEEKRELEKPVDKVKVAKDLAEALYLPITVGAVSVTAIFMSYRIQNNRIAVLAGSLAASQARNLYFENKYRKQHGDEAYAKFITPTEEVETGEVDKKGKPVVKEIMADIDKTIGQWYDQSEEYLSDDHSYNMQYIDAVNDRMQTILFQRGSLLLNEVREALGFDRIRSGALLGWTTSDNFDIDKMVHMLADEEGGELKEQIWVTWTRPRYIYDDVEFNGRYSVY